MTADRDLSVGRFKRAIIVGLLAVGAVAGVLVLRQAGAAVLRTSRGADPASAFHRPLTPAEDIAGVIDWAPDPLRDGRAMEPATRLDITNAYAAAWAALDRAGRGDPAAALDTYLAGAALDQGRAALTGTTRSATRHVSHRLVLTFYSDDGSIAAIEDPEMEIERIVGTGTAALSISATEHLRAVLVLEDGTWRVHLIERMSPPG